MSAGPSPSVHEHEEFSLPLFALTSALSLSGLLFLLWLLLPAVWEAQFLSTWPKALAAFLLISLVNCYVEYFFHRYVLHAPWIPFVRRLYRQHTLHHALTRIARKPSRDGRGIWFIENKFPITEPEQGEASFFPWYSLIIFALVLAPLLALLQWLLPSFPWVFSGLAALTVSLSLYEILHAINHWPFEQWQPLIEHPRWGAFWRPLYSFHLRHHAVIHCNESISGFFGLPLADWTFGTCLMPKSIYADGEEWTPDKFVSPLPCRPVRWLDKYVEQAVQGRRAQKTQELGADSLKPREPRGESIASWVTHGLGLAVSVAGLTLLIVFASLRGDSWHVVSFTVFGLSMLVLHTLSTVYQALRKERVKQRFEPLVHASFFLLIAGTYTPILLMHLRGPWAWSLFGVVWGLCAAGAVFKLLFGQKHRLALAVAGLSAAWVLVIALGPLAQHVPQGALWLLVAGVFCYSISFVFNHWPRPGPRHALWHLLALGGSTCHLLALLLFMLPHS
jgi:hemolysin III